MMFEIAKVLFDFVELFANLPEFHPHFAAKIRNLGADRSEMFDRDALNVFSHSAPRLRSMRNDNKNRHLRFSDQALSRKPLSPNDFPHFPSVGQQIRPDLGRDAG